MRQEDINFLKELQQELNTQDNEGNADPVVWGVDESIEKLVPDGCGDYQVIVENCEKYTKEEYIELIEELISEIDDIDERKEIEDKWVNEVDKSYLDDLVDFANDYLALDTEIYDARKEHQISHYANSFLTKRACQEYIDKFGYNHSEPKTYSMCCYRNYELKRLLDILKNINFNDIKIDD